MRLKDVKEEPAKISPNDESPPSASLEGIAVNDKEFQSAIDISDGPIDTVTELISDPTEIAADGVKFDDVGVSRVTSITEDCHVIDIQSESSSDSESSDDDMDPTDMTYDESRNKLEQLLSKSERHRKKAKRDSKRYKWADWILTGIVLILGSIVIVSTLVLP